VLIGIAALALPLKHRTGDHNSERIDIAEGDRHRALAHIPAPTPTRLFSLRPRCSLCRRGDVGLLPDRIIE
jgi:hypothetical protein